MREISTARAWARWIPSALGIIIVVALVGYLVDEDIVTLAGASRASGTPTGVGANIGMLAPDFSLADIYGNELKLSDFRGQAVMINFWASWCPPCREEMPLMEAAYNERSDKGMAILAVAVNDDAGAVTSFVKELSLTFPVAVDNDNRVALLYRVRAIPTTFFVDREGVIRDIQTGPMDKKAMLKKLSRIM
ncbi:MAG: redoxin domain-containing protein [Chloroflexi bacterium]|nr:redoxin domain-containing protein [Chloroflexota bacterium]